MKLVFGLGNPGKEYVGTRHNMGFIVLDEWAYQHHEKFNRSAFSGEYFETFMNNEKVLFIKPTTYMNRSGMCVVGFLNYYKVALEDIIIIYDDMDLEPGRLRLRQKGSAGGHNGMKDIIKQVGKDTIKRIKVGVGHPDGKSVVTHVLSRFPKEQNAMMLNTTRSAVDAIDYWLNGHTFEETMSHFNQ